MAPDEKEVFIHLTNALIAVNTTQSQLKQCIDALPAQFAAIAKALVPAAPVERVPRAVWVLVAAVSASVGSMITIGAVMFKVLP